MAAGGLFESVIVDRRAPEDPRLPELMAWAARFAALGFTPSYGPGDHGNLSCRTPQGLVITARETAKAALRPEHFVEVLGVARRGPRAELQCRGLRLPSTDALMHLDVYQRRPEVQAILHGHDAEALARAEALSLPVTSVSARESSLALIDAVCGLVQRHDYLILRDHGFLALGASVEEAGALVRTVHARAQALGRPGR